MPRPKTNPPSPFAERLSEASTATVRQIVSESQRELQRRRQEEDELLEALDEIDDEEEDDEGDEEEDDEGDDEEEGDEEEGDEEEGDEPE